MLKRWFQLTRAHTAPLEAVPAILGASIATGGVFNKSVALWGLLGVLYHLTGYGWNSVSDWRNGYDVGDPRKKHHPLNTGEISYKDAVMAVSILFVSGLGLAIILIGRGNIIALLPLGLAIASGVVYNEIGKEFRYTKFIPISIAHSMMFVIPYMSLSDPIEPTFLLLGFSYVFFWVAYQISISGEYKDITKQDEEENFLEHLGVEVGEDANIYVWSDKQAWIWAGSVRATITLLGASILLLLGGENSYFGALILYTILAIVSLLQGTTLVSTGPMGEYMYMATMRKIAAIEAVTLIMMVLAFTPAIGWTASIALIAGSVVWVLSFNKIEWGTLLAPKV